MEEGSLDSKTSSTLGRAIKEYLKKRKNRTEKWLLNKFKEYMERKKPNTYIKDVTPKDFDRFLSSLTVSQETLKNYESRLKAFQKYIGLLEIKVKKNRNPKNDECSQCPHHRESEKEVAKAKEVVAAHRQTIDGLIKEKAKECSQCPKIASLNEEIALTKATLEKEKKENKERTDQMQYIIDSGRIEDIKQLEAENIKLKEEITRGKKTIENQQFVKARCPEKGVVVLFGNDCWHCDQSITCPKYGELTNPEEK